MRHLLGIAMLVAALGAGLWVQRLVDGPQAGFSAPAREMTRPTFTLADLGTGKPRSVTEWDGKKIVLNFWASWCPPCLEEMPLFVKLQKRYADAGVQFVGVAIDTPDNARPMAHRLKLNYPNLVGELDAMDLARRLGNGNGVLPFTVLINAQGKVEGTHEGVVRQDTLEKWLDAP